MASSVIRILRHDSGVRIGDDPEDVHQARVGTRRLRSDLQTFESLLDAEWLTELVVELKWLGGALGEVRDADVLLERLRRQAASLPQADAPGAATLVRRLVQQREVARAALLEAMAGPRYVELLDRLVVAAQNPMLRPEAEAKATDVLPELVLRPWKKLAKAVKELDDPPPDEQLHATRIRAKRCRYAVEAVAPVVGKEAKRLASAVAGAAGRAGRPPGRGRGRGLAAGSGPLPGGLEAGGGRAHRPPAGRGRGPPAGVAGGVARRRGSEAAQVAPLNLGRLKAGLDRLG